MSFFRSRAMDLLFSFFFFLFVLICSLVEAPVCLGEKVSPTSELAAIRMSHWWGLMADKIWVVQPQWSRIAVCYHSLFFGPFYALFCIGFFMRWNWIQKPGLLVGAMKLYAGAYYITTNLLNEKDPPASPVLFLSQSASYMVIPLLLVVRMWNEAPFSTGVTTGSKKRA